MRTIALLVMAGVIGLGSSRPGWGAAANMLPNPSFELGGTKPDGWLGYGLKPHQWEYQAPDGEHCVSVSGDGLYANGWYALRWVRPRLNWVYGLSYLVRKQTRKDPLRRPPTQGPGTVTVGLHRVRWHVEADETWREQSFHFRSPDGVAQVRCELGQEGVAGTVSFDRVALYPAVAVHRCNGLGRYALGEGERIVDRVYTAVQRFGGPHTNDWRFLHSYTAEYVHDRWVLDGTDLVVYAHRISIIGAPRMTPGVVDPGGVLQGNYTRSDPDARRFIDQEGAKVKLEVARCQGTLLVEAGLGPNGPWHPIKAIEQPGTYELPIPAMWQAERIQALRLQALWAKRIEVTGYEYTSSLAMELMREPLIGATTYLSVLCQSRDLQFEVLDVGEHVPDGRNSVTLRLTNKGERRTMVSQLIVKREGTVVSASQEEFLVAPESDALRHLRYTVGPAGEHRMELTISDQQTGEVLLQLEGDFTVPPPPEGNGDSAGPGVPTPPAPTPPQ